MRVFALLVFTPALAVAQATDTTNARRDSTQRLEGVAVTAIRAPLNAPVFASTMDAPAIKRRSFGQDIPLLLQGTASLTSHAETGNYWGYSYIRLRGIDQSRINLTLDGIPLNDPEDQVLYFADFPDLASSLSSIQVQRGVGTSAPGTASYGGSINLQTTPIASTTRGTESQLQLGSFGSQRASLMYSTGLSASRFAMTARMSALQSDGYRDHSGTSGLSGHLSLGWVGAHDVVKLTALTGTFRDTLAYVGATRAELDTNDRANLLRPDETDKFSEQVVALSHTSDRGNMLLSNTLYRISAGGDYFICVALCDQGIASGAVLWNQGLDFVWYGATSVVSIGRGATRLSGGININDYARDHRAFQRDSAGDAPLYLNTGHKNDASVFAKIERDVGRFTLFGDVQARYAKFRYEPDVNAGIVESSITWTFLNPKIGATMRVRPDWTAYVSHGVNHREPARNDMFAGFDNLDSANAAFVGPFGRLSPELVHDTETGLRRRGERWNLDANLFLMAFRNEILPIGALSIYGLPLRTNVKSSWRRGVELDYSARITNRFRAGLNTTLMRARIAEFTDDNTATTYTDVPPLLTPEFLTTQTMSLDVTKAITVDFTGKFVGNSRLTNTDDPTLAIHSQYTSDLAARWTRGDMTLSLLLNNATNVRRFAGGHQAGTDARFYVLPPRNLHVLLRFRT
jgi:iron complex outermembrane receptor protein